jgi:hypothetical protein
VIVPGWVVNSGIIGKALPGFPSRSAAGFALYERGIDRLLREHFAREIGILDHGFPE